MKITVLGAAGTVTGSKYLVSTEKATILIDCGLFQGFKNLRERNWTPLPFESATLDAVVLTHAHLDHSGYLPVLVESGFTGTIFSHAATQALCGILLPDSGHIQESDAKFANKHGFSKHRPAIPLYDQKQALAALRQFKGLEFHQTFEIGDLRVWLHPTGHILGAAAVVLEHQGKRIIFSGDIGRPNDILMKAPEPLPACDVLFVESTYGNRRHDADSSWNALASIVNQTVERGGVIAMPCFAVGRAQTLQHMLDLLIREEKIPELPIYLDSPMAIDTSHIYCHFRELHRLDETQCKSMCRRTQYLTSVEESKSLSKLTYPHVILAGSGMMTGGRILHHLKRLVGNHRNSIILAGYQAGGTRGARLAAGESAIKIHGNFYDVKAEVHSLNGLSGHADYQEIIDWLKLTPQTPSKIFVVHGDPEAADQMRLHLQEQLGAQAYVPSLDETITL